MNNVAMQLRLPQELKSKLDAEAQRRYITPSSMARLAIARGLEAIDLTRGIDRIASRPVGVSDERAKAF